jgi:hypothetical protein
VADKGRGFRFATCSSKQGFVAGRLSWQRGVDEVFGMHKGKTATKCVPEELCEHPKQAQHSAQFSLDLQSDRNFWPARAKARGFRCIVASANAIGAAANEAVSGAFPWARAFANVIASPVASDPRARVPRMGYRRFVARTPSRRCSQVQGQASTVTGGNFSMRKNEDNNEDRLCNCALGAGLLNAAAVAHADAYLLHEASRARPT